MARYKRPGFTQIPNEIFDEHMPQLGPNEFKVLCLIARRTIGYHRDHYALSLDSVVAGAGISRGTAVTAIQSLLDSEHIVRVSDGEFGGHRPKPATYALNIEEPELAQNPDQTTGTEVEPVAGAEIEPATGAEIEPVLVQNLDQPIRSKEKEEIYTERNTLPSLSDPNNSTTSEQLSGEADETQIAPRAAAAESDYDDVDTGCDACTFVIRQYKRKGRTMGLRNGTLKARSNQATVNRFEALEKEHGKAEARVALSRFLDDESDEWLQENEWPLNSFFKRADNYLPDAPAKPASRPATRPAAPARTHEPSPAVRAAQNVPDGVSVFVPEYLQFVHIWDTLISEWPVGQLEVRDMRRLEAQLAKSEFHQKFHVVAEKCRRLIDAGRMDNVSFRWLMMGKDEANWEKVLDGQFDWAMKSDKKSTANMSPTRRLIEQLRAEKAAREAAASKEQE